MSAEEDQNAVNEAATLLANDIAGFVVHSNVSCAVALTAMAKLLGQGAAQFGGDDPTALLEAAFQAARNEMRLRAMAVRLQAAGLGALMPVRPV